MEKEKIKLITENSNQSVSEEFVLEQEKIKQKVLNSCKNDNSIIEYLDVLKIEYERDLSKRQSWQSRAGIILTVLSAICVFVLDKVNFSEVIKLFSAQLTFLVLIKILSGICVYIFFILSLIFSIKTIGVTPLAVFDTETITDFDLGKVNIEGAINIVHGYKKIMKTNRVISQKTVKHLKKAYIFMMIAVVSISVYINIPINVK